MGNPFPTPREQGNKYRNLAIGFTFVSFTLWVVTYMMGMMLIYGFLCPPLLIAAIRFSYQTIRYTKSLSGYFLLLLSGIFFLISLAPWFFPIAR